MTKANIMKIIGIGSAILLAVLILAACRAPSASPAEQTKMLPVVKVVPDTGAPRTAADYYGANFVPGQKVAVAWLVARGTGPKGTIAAESILSSAVSEEGKTLITVGKPAERGMLQVDEVGSFCIKGSELPAEEGIWPIRVYSEDGEMLASTLVVVKNPEKK